MCLLPLDRPDERRELEALAAWCRRFSPIVGLEQSDGVDGLLLDITGLAHLFGGETALAKKIVDDFTGRGLTVRMAVADTVGAAWAVAACGRGTAAFTLVPPGETPAALRPLPVEALRLPADVVGLLHQLGIDRIGQLEALPRRELSSRLTPRLIERWDQALGRLDEPIPVHLPAAKFEAHWSPEHPTARRETIEAALERLIHRVAEMLARLGRGAMRLDCRLDCHAGDCPNFCDGDCPDFRAAKMGLSPLANPQTKQIAFSVGLFEPTASAKHLFELARVQLERLQLPSPVAVVYVEATSTALLAGRQQELFADHPQRLVARHLPSLVERLSNRLGHWSVVGVRLLRDAQPELAWRADPLVEGPRRRRRNGISVSELPPRPLRLLRRPIALAAMATMPDGPPMQFHLYGRRHQVAHTWGPERIETGWWRGRTVGRDYYRIETTAGRRFWIFRRLRDGRWFVHGMFE